VCLLHLYRNKFDDSPYMKKTPATIQYCKQEKSWVFMHHNIRKEDPNIRSADTSDCPWLLRSPETVSYDLLEVNGAWTQWTGKSICVVVCSILHLNLVWVCTNICYNHFSFIFINCETRSPRRGVRWCQLSHNL